MLHGSLGFGSVMASLSHSLKFATVYIYKSVPAPVLIQLHRSLCQITEVKGIYTHAPGGGVGSFN